MLVNPLSKKHRRGSLNMKTTAKLAYSQIKINRLRTVWTLAGIALSTAFITAVCCFAASGSALAVDLQGYGDSGGALGALLVMPAGIVVAIIFTMSVVGVTNAFRVSAGERIVQFGLLKSVGAVKRQIVSCVMYESLFLSAAGIPMGIVVGLVIAFSGVLVANHFLGELNSLIHMMLNELTIVIDFVVAWQALIAAALISFSAVLFSAWLPARKAANITAVAAIRGAGEVKMTAKQLRVSPLIQRLFGFEGVLAAKNMRRNKRNFRASTVSLTVSVVLFIAVSALYEQAQSIEAMMFPDVDATVIVEYTSLLRDGFVNETTGRTETVIAAPIDSATANVVTGKLCKYKNTAIMGTGDDMNTYTAIVPREAISPKMLEVYFYPEERSEYEISTEILTLDRDNYAALCKQAGVPVGSNILINHYGYNDDGREASLVPFLFEKEDLRLRKADGSVSEIPVHGVLTEENIPGELLPLNRRIVRLIVPQGEMRNYIWYANPADIEGFIAYANVVMEETFPQDQESGYMELGFNTRVYTIRDYMKVMNIGIDLTMVFAGGFVVLLTFIGLTNVISTISANVRMRSREFAVLRTVGMTYDGLKRMLNFESVICTAKSLTIGLPVAIVLTYLINLPIRSAFPIPYQFPWLACVYCVCAVSAVTWITMRYSAFRLRGGHTIEAIPSEREW
jgi:putative ABC transport system permease protein